MAQALRGLIIAFVLFAASFALHIVGGATGQSWLFALAVALIYLAATGFPVLALWAGRPAGWMPRQVTLIAGTVIGVALTAGALWAANDRSWAWWHIFAAPALVLGSSMALLAARRWLRRAPRQQAAGAPR